MVLEGVVYSASVYVCESQPIVIAGLEKVLSATERLRLVGTGKNLSEAISGIASLAPDLVLLGQLTSARSMLPMMNQVQEASPRSRIILWSVEVSDQEMFRALQLGAKGILPKTLDVSQLIECLDAVAEGKIWLEGAGKASEAVGTRSNTVLRITPREREIIAHVCRGMKNREIGEALSITAGTVKVHLMHIFEKTGLQDRFQLALQGRQLIGEE
jgi:DNA-binding NarL/FixJ family response regulator